MRDLFIRALIKLKLFKKINLIFKERIGKKVFRIPIINGVGLYNLQSREPWMTTLLERLFEFDRNAFLDIGVNIGQTLLKVRGVDSSRPYFGCEPNVNCLAYLDELVSLNNISGCTLIPAGIAESNGLIKLNLYSTESVDASASFDENYRGIEGIVESKFVSAFCYEDVKQHLDQNIGIVKIDVEGFELSVLRSLEELIISNTPLIVIEILPVYTQDQKYRLEKQKNLQDLLSQLGYSIFRIRKSEKDDFLFLELLEEIGIHDNLNWCDYVLCHDSRVLEIQSLIGKE